MRIRLQYLEWFLIDTVQGSGIMNPVEKDIIYHCRLSSV